MNQEKAKALRKLEEKHRSAQAAIDGIDLNTVIHADSGWTVKDFIAHIADWEQHMLAAVQAFLDGETYIIPDYGGHDEVDRLNADMRFNHLEETPEAVLAYWHDVREAFMRTVSAVSDEKLGEPITTPWDRHETTTAIGMAKSALWHENEHISDIVERHKNVETP